MSDHSTSGTRSHETSSTGAAARFRQATNLCELVQDSIARYPDRVALRTPDGKVEITWSEFGEQVRRIAGGLAELGVGHGDTVAMVLTNRPELSLVDTAANHLGAAGFSIYSTSAPEQIRVQLENSDAPLVVTEQLYLDNVLAGRPEGVNVVCIDRPSSEDYVSLSDLEKKCPEDFDLEPHWRAVGPDDLLTLIYTSGTTGAPKGVQHTHRGVLNNMAAIIEIPEVAAGFADGRLISYLPDAHGLNRVLTHYMGQASGSTVTTLSDYQALAATLPSVRPTIFLAVPMLWYKIEAGVERALQAMPEEKQTAVRGAIEIGKQVARHSIDRTPVPAELQQKYDQVKDVALTPIVTMLGLDQVDCAVTGAAPIAVETLELLMALGIPCCEAWGMSEILLATMNRPGALRPGTVGPNLAGVDIRVAADGEILIQTDALMRGYRKNPEATKGTFDADGWLRTGDVGTLDDDGYLRIVDRKKELIINSGGKNIAPAGVEGPVKIESPLIGSVVAIGDARKYLTALIVLDQEAAEIYAQAHGLRDVSAEALAADQRVIDEIDNAVQRANARLSRVEQIKDFVILPTYWVPGGDELTPTMKLRRAAINGKYGTEIAALYTT